jgi:signal transduction histidine kinase
VAARHARRPPKPAWSRAALLVAPAAVVVIETLRHFALPLADPPLVHLLAVAVASLAGGTGPGLVTAAVTFAHALYALADTAEPGWYTREAVARLVILALGGPALVALLTALTARRARLTTSTEGRAVASRRGSPHAPDEAPAAPAIVRWERDAEFLFTTVSDEAETLLGYPAEQFLADSGFWTGGIHPDDRGEVAATYAAVRAGAGRRTCEYRVLASDGRFVRVREELETVGDSATTPPRYRGTLSEASVARVEPLAEARRIAEASAPPPGRVAEEEPSVDAPRAPADRVEPATADATPGDARRAAEPPTSGADIARALATLADELRPLVDATLGWVRVLRRSPDEAARSRALDTIERSAELEARRLDDVALLAALAAGELRLSSRPVDVALVVQSAIEATRPLAVARAVVVDAALEPALGLVVGDAERLGHVAWSLIAGAVGAAAPGHRVAVALRREGETVRITVADGRRITPEELARPFESWRAGAAGEGLGIGLAVARGLVELHGGTLTAERGETGQTVLVVSLPAADVAWPPAGARGLDAAA